MNDDLDNEDQSGHAEEDAYEIEFTIFFKTEIAKLVAFLLMQGAPAEQAADCAQQAMVELYQVWTEVDSPRGWVRTTAKRLWWKTNRDSPVPMADPPDQPLLTSADAAEIEARHDFLAMVRAMPDRQREVLAWSFDGYTPTEIAQLLGLDPANVRSSLRQARISLRASQTAWKEI